MREQKKILTVAFPAARPDEWIRQKTGEQPWSKQEEILKALAIHRRVAVASANGCGKSWLAARAAVWFLDTYKPSIVVTTAPTDRQVRRILWREIHTVAAEARRRGYDMGGKLLTKSWEMSPEHFAFGFATRDYDADAFQGLHGEHILLIVDEAAGISEPIWEGIMAVLRGSHAKLLAIGNPTNLDGTFYRAFSAQGWWTTHISAFETPNLQGNGIVIPGLVTEQDVEDSKEDWGEGSFLWQARILGRFPDKVEDTLISLSWVEAAGNENPKREGPIEVAADIARYGGDSTVFVARQGDHCFHGVEYSQQSTMETAGKLVQYCRQHKAVTLKIDGVGLGAGVVDRCREILKDVEIIEMNAGGKPIDPKNYADAGTEWWHGLAKKLQSGAIGGPVFSEKRVLRELSSRRYKYLSDGRMKLQSKEEMRGKGLKSPDWGDAIAMAFAAPKPKPNYKLKPVLDLQSASKWR